MSSWSIVSTLKEQEEIVRRFVEHHLFLGCEKVYLYFDDPADPAKRLFAGNPRVVVADASTKAESMEKKQSLNASDAYRLCESDWLLHLDADELVHAPNGPVSQVLDQVEPHIQQVTIRPWEGIYSTIADANDPYSATTFRAPLTKTKKRRALQKQCWPDAGDRLKAGMTGYTNGKSFIRKTGLKAVGGCHFWRIKDSATPLVSSLIENDLVLLHFDAMTYLSWKAKLARRANGSVIMKGMGPHRLKQLEAFKAAHATGKEELLIALFESLYVVKPAPKKTLAKHKVLQDFKIPSKDQLAAAAPQLSQPLPAAPPAVKLQRVASPAPSTPVAIQKSTSAKELLALAKQEAALRHDELALAAIAKGLSLPKAAKVNGKQHCALLVDLQQLKTSLFIRNGQCGEAAQAMRELGHTIATDVRKKIKTSATFKPRRMIFVCGLHRSGTTLLEDWISSSYVCASLESRVPKNEGQFLQDVYTDEQPFGGPGRFAFSSPTHETHPLSDSEARRQESRIRSTWEPWIIDDCDILLEKSPPNITKINYLRQVFPGSKFIIWTRDPRVTSLATLKWAKTSYKELLLHWHVAYSAALNQMAEDCIVAKYEDFCTSPLTVLQGIANFCGLKEKPPAPDRDAQLLKIKSSNQDYLAKAPNVTLNLRFKSWRSFGYEF